MVQCIAKQAFLQQWEVIKSRILQNEYLQLNETYKGRSAVHWSAIHGNVLILEMLLSLEDIDKMDVNDRRTALHLAAEHDRVDCVKLLLDYGANKDMKDLNGMTPLHLAAKHNHEGVIRVLLQGHALLNIQDHAGKTPLDLAYGTAKTWMRQTSTFTSHMRDFNFIDEGDESKLRDWLDNSPDEIDLYDQDRRTALMHAVLANQENFVHLILRRGPNVDQTDFDGMTALMHAVHVGNHEIVSMILADFADLDIEDANGNTAMMHIGDVLAAHECRDMSEWEHCKSLLKKENVYRSSSEEYRERFQQKVEASIRKQTGFNESLFRRAINRHPELGVMFLNECMVVDRHTLSFHNLGLIYGKGIRSSALYCMLHPQNQDVQYRINKSVLSHIVMRRVVELKWEMFGQRIYLQQILAYLLLLSTMTISAFLVGTDIASTTSSNTTAGSNSFDIVDACRFNWCFVVSFVICGRLAVKGLYPEYFWTCARFLYDGKFTEFNPDVIVPNLPKYKRRVKRVLVGITLLGTTIGSCVMNWNVLPWLGISHENPLRFFIMNNVFLWLTALYFLRLEIRELLGESGDFFRGIRRASAQESKLFRRGAQHYFSSYVNRIQLALYCTILFIYVPASMFWVRDALLNQYKTWGPVTDADLKPYGAFGSGMSSLLHYIFTGPPIVVFNLDLLRFVLAVGMIVTLTGWGLTLQFLEIHSTAGFLLPMLPAMLSDLWNFCIFYAAIHWGFTACFYIYLHGTDQTVVKFGHTFTSVFFVMFGQQIDIQDPFTSLDSGTSSSRTAYEMYGTALAMLHSGVVVVFMLNLLLAMMNKSMGDGLERAKTEALASYARCILRMELSMENQETSQYITVSEVDSMTNKPIQYLNPAFAETKNKTDFSITEADEAILRSFDESTKEWHGGLKRLKGIVLAQWTLLRDGILDVEMTWDSKPSLQKILEKRESAIRSLLATASAAPHPTKLNVETRFSTLGEQILVELDKLIEVDPSLFTEHGNLMKITVAEAFDAQIETTREAMCEPSEINFGSMWKLTQQQWKRQEKRLLEFEKSITDDTIAALTSRLEILLGKESFDRRGLERQTTTL